MTCASAFGVRPVMALAGLAAALPGAVAAQAWTAQTGGQLRWQYDSNPSLVADAAAQGLNTVQISASPRLSWRSEVAESDADAELILDRSDSPGNDDTQALGRLTLRHRLIGERDIWRAGLSYRLDRPLDGDATAGDVALGRNLQSVAEVNLGWSHALSERLSAEFDARHERTTSDVRALATSYSVSAGTAAFQYAWNETINISLSLGHTQQRQDQTGTNVSIDSLRLGWSGAVSETATLTLSVAPSRVRQDVTLRGVACPLPVQFCNAGLVPFVPVEQRVRTYQDEVQYSAAAELRLSERSSLSGRVSSALPPGSLGVSVRREDQAMLKLGVAWSERLRGGLGFDESRTAFLSNDTSARLRSWSLDGSYQWQEGLNLVLQLQHRQYRGALPGSGGSSQILSISLQYSGATLTG